jgi:hypothetical protein
MKNCFLILFFVLCLKMLSAQKADSIIGQWKFADIYKLERNDSANTKMTRTLYSEMTLHFKKNRQYKAVAQYTKEEGNWGFDEETRTITMVNSKGVESEMELIAVTADKLIVSWNRSSFILKRTAKE